MSNSDTIFEKLVRNKYWDWSYSVQKTTESNQFGSGDTLDSETLDLVGSMAAKWKPVVLPIFYGGGETMPSTTSKSTGSKWEGLDDDSIRNPHYQPKNFFVPETWEDNFNLNARVYQLDKTTVYCDCLVDPDEQLFEKRVFPRQLFEHLYEVKEGSLVVIKIRSKKGAMRIDITDGRGIVSPDIFEMESMWDSLKSF